MTQDDDGSAPMLGSLAASLTHEQRVAIDWAATIARQQSQVAIHKVLREMLAEHARSGASHGR
jgi:hypothetical protein